MKRPFFLATLMALVALSSAVFAEETLRWERLPLSASLWVGQERVIFFDHPVRIGVPASIRERLHAQSAGGALYLKASAPFESTRLQVEETDTGTLILLDVRATRPPAGQAALEPLRILDGRPAAAPDTTPPNRGAASTAQSPDTPVPVALTRYAAQSLYAPLRVVEPLLGIERVPLPRSLGLDGLLPEIHVRSSALAAWRLGDFWVTAIKITNQSGDWLILDPRSLQGDFSAATFQHQALGPEGDSTDTTVLYLVTHSHGLAESLPPAAGPAEASKNLPPQGAHP